MSAKQVYFATTNKGKVHSMRAAVAPYNIEVVHVPLEIPELRSESLRAVARQKVVAAFDSVKKPCVAVDSGFYLEAFPGFPGTYTNFALESLGLEGILRLAEGRSRGCHFKNCLAYIDGLGSEPVYFESEVHGSLSEQPQGNQQSWHWSPLFKIFIPEGYKDTLAELSEQEYERWRKSRMKDSFLTKFAEWLVQK